jgi:hypothetical protein
MTRLWGFHACQGKQCSRLPSSGWPECWPSSLGSPRYPPTRCAGGVCESSAAAAQSILEPYESNKCIDFQMAGDAHRYLPNQTTVSATTVLLPAPVHLRLTRESCADLRRSNCQTAGLSIYLQAAHSPHTAFSCPAISDSYADAVDDLTSGREGK